jgi:O-antigen/teichoic acid export membrane protein
MEKESLSYRALKNSSYTFIGYVFPILFSIFITPVMVHKLGVEDYGVYILVNTIMAFLSLLDLGLGVALVKYISQYQAEGNHEGLKNLLNSAYCLYFAIGVLGFGIYVILGKFFLQIFHITGQSQQHILVVFSLAAVLFFLNSINQMYAIVPAALQRFDITTKINLSQLTVFNLSILVAVLFGYKLKVILFLNVITVLGMLLAFRWQLKKVLPEIRLRFVWSRNEVVKAYKFGLLAAANNLASNSLIQLDRFVIPIFLGPASLSYYSLPGNVAQKTGGIVGSLAGALFPMTSSLVGEGEHDHLKIIYRKVMRNATLMAAACTMAIISFAYQILYYWLGKDFADKGWLILIIVAVTYFLLALFTILQNFLLGMNKVKFLMFTSLGFAVLNIIFLVLLVPKFGIVGAAWAYLAGVLPVPAVFYWVEKKFLGLKNQAGYYFKLYLKLVITSACYYLLMHFLVSSLVTSLPALVVIGPLAVLSYFFIYYLFGFIETEDWQLFMLFWQKIKARLGFGRRIVSQ